MARSRAKLGEPQDTAFHQTGPFHRVEGSARPKTVNDIRISEVNTQRYAAGSRGPTAGGTSGQGPAMVGGGTSGVG